MDDDAYSWGIIAAFFVAVVVFFAAMPDHSPKSAHIEMVRGEG